MPGKTFLALSVYDFNFTNSLTDQGEKMLQPRSPKQAHTPQVKVCC